MTDANLLRKHNEAVGHAKRLIIDRIKDHIVPHIIEKKTANEMWKALTSLYEGRSVQRKMLLETQMWSFMMTKGENIEHFLFRLQSIRDKLTATGAKVEDDVMVRTALNAVTNEWETFVQSILGTTTSQMGTTCGQFCVKKNSADSPKGSTTLA